MSVYLFHNLHMSPVDTHCTQSTPSTSNKKNNDHKSSYYSL
jgi:hypothetical protein